MEYSIHIYASCPSGVAARIVFLRPFPLEHRFGFSVANLLLPVRSHGPAVVMPNHRARTESKLPPSLPGSPANIHVITGLAKLRIKSANGLEPALSKSHVASRNVLCFAVGKEHMSRSAGGPSNASRRLSVVSNWNVRPSHTCIVRLQECEGQIGQPIWIGPRIIIYICDKLPGRGLPSQVPRGAQAAVLGANQAHVVLRRNIAGAVGRAIINHDGFVVGITKPPDRFQAIAKGAAPVVRAYHHRNSRPCLMGIAWDFFESLANCAQRAFRLSVPSR